MITNIVNSYKAFKTYFIRVMSDKKAECVIPTDTLETIARCLLPDIMRYYEDKRNEEKSASESFTHLTKEAV